MGEEKGRRESLKLLSLVLNTSASLRDKRLEEFIGLLLTPTQDKKQERERRMGHGVRKEMRSETHKEERDRCDAL